MQERTVTDLAVASGMTVAELHAIPDDGQRRELIDGELFVTPSPNRGHQVVLGRLFSAVVAAAPGRIVVFAPVDVRVDTHTLVQPDLVVYGVEQSRTLTPEHAADDAPVPEIVVEVSSPSTRRIDLIHKRRLYERAGVVEYWFVDRDAEVIDVYAFGEDDDLRSATGDEQIPSGLLVPAATVSELLAW